MIYLIRHAQSTYNIAEAQVVKLYQGKPIEKTQQYLNIKFNLKFQDCEITPQGIQQCKECRQKINGIEFDLIIVSPMRRALMTCHEIFKGYDKCPIIVDPDFREIFESACDIGSRLRQSMKDFPNFDYSLIENPDYWYIEAVQNKKEKEEMLKKLDGADDDIKGKKMMLEYLENIWERREENPELKKQVLPPLEGQKNKLRELLKKYSSIAVVSHSENIKSYIGYKPKNCSVVGLKPQYLDCEPEEVPFSEM